MGLFDSVTKIFKDTARILVPGVNDYYTGKEQAKAARRMRAAEQRAAAISRRQQVRAMLAERRLAGGRQIQGAANTGTIFGSGFLGAQGSLNTQQSTRLGEFNQGVLIGDLYNRGVAQYERATEQGALFGAIGDVVQMAVGAYGGYGKLGSTIFGSQPPAPVVDRSSKVGR